MNEEKEINCPLCGYKFNKSESENSCVSCPLHNKSCGNVKCPNCGYDFPVPGDFSISKLWDKVFKK
ncbi:MAG: hypothetical protein ACOC1O_05200 [bacterium]